MLARALTGLALLLLGNLLCISPARANVFPQLEPCLAKKLPMLQTLPGTTSIIQVMGHQFRKDDECVPFYVTFTWENHYDRDDGYSHYSLHFVQSFAGELWYSTDKQEFTLVGNPAQWKGASKIRAFDGYGQVCSRFDEIGKCLELHKFDRGAARAVKTPDEYLASLNYAYPAITTQGESVPVTLYAGSPEFEFKDARRRWAPNDGHFEISNPALVAFDFPKLITAAASKGTYTTTINYNRNNELDESSHDKGKLVIKLDFDPECKGINNSDMDPCQQIVRLIDDLEMALQLRDLYPEALLEIDAAPNYDIDKLVAKKLQQRDPYITDADIKWMFENSGKTDPVTLDFVVPDYCNKCTASPLCEWQHAAVTRHEQANVEYLESHPAELEKLKQKPPYLDANQHGRDVAKITSDMEYHSYNERARFLKEIFFQELNHQRCTISPGMYGKIQSLIDDIN